MRRFGVVLIVCVAECSPAWGVGVVQNGNFSSGLTGWTTSGPVTDSGGFALLAEDAVSAVTSLEQEIVIPAFAGSLRFDFTLSSEPDGTSGFPFPDGLAAYLLDPVTFVPILATPGFSDYFYLDRVGFDDYDPSIVRVDGNTVRLDVTSVPAGTPALIAFDLLGGDDGYATLATIDNVGVSFIPEPVTALGVALACGAVGVRLRRRLRAG